jgi:hypothetical protein
MEESHGRVADSSPVYTDQQLSVLLDEIEDCLKSGERCVATLCWPE